LDLFTDRAFGGNPLGVFPEASGMDDGLMQRIAREMSLSETVFLFPPETSEGTRRVRIFTPGMEVPFAGHPTVGTAYFLAATGAVDIGPEGGSVLLEENVGPVRVEVEVEGGRPARTVLTAAVLPEHRPVPWARAELARLVSLPPDSLGYQGLEAEMVSCGLPFVVVPVRDLEAVRRSRLDLGAWDDLTRGAWSRMIYVLTMEAEGADVDAHVRMYAPGAGVPEDPATGSAAAALAGYLGRRAAGDGVHGWRIEQGLEIGRPSLLEAEATVEGGAVARVRVGGRSVLMSRGVMDVPWP
jgi:trans-2,3-dihydro-3-hydroxyanthranilate isomerase